MVTTTPKKRGRPAKINAPQKDIPTYTVSLSYNDQEFTCETTDLVDALLNLKPEKITTKMILKVSSGSKQIERFLFPRKAKYLFLNRLHIEFFVKQLKLGLA